MSTCPVTTNQHRTPGPTCGRCVDAVLRHLAWYEAQTPERQKLIDSGAWVANDTMHWRALEVRALREAPLFEAVGFIVVDVTR